MGEGVRAEDLAVVIPTRDRWDTLGRCLGALARQTAGGFEVVVVADGRDQQPPPLDAKGMNVKVVVADRRGPGGARNEGVRSTARQVVLLLGDDILLDPGAVAAHLGVHDRERRREVAVLGRTDWHPDVASDRVARWLDWSGTQFDYRVLDRERPADAGFGRFYSSNVSLRRDLYTDAGGFDEEFPYAAYEDIEFGYRLAKCGMVLRYEPRARATHVHRYDLTALERRFQAVGRSERMMVRKHPWFNPFFRDRFEWHAGAAPVSVMWARVVDRVPSRPRPLRSLVERRADRWYHQRLAGAFLDAYEGERGVEELREYLGERYDEQRLRNHATEVEAEERAAPDEGSFYRTSEAYLYDLTVFAMSGTKAPYRDAIRRILPAPAALLDYGCGIGFDGLRLLDAGYRVAFADYDNPSTRFLRWRLEQRGIDAPVYDLDDDVPGGFDLVYAFDVIEHVADPFAFLAELEKRGDVVVVNLLEPSPADAHLHRPLPIRALLDHAARGDVRWYRRYHGRSHLVAYRPARRSRPSVAAARARVAALATRS